MPDDPGEYEILIECPVCDGDGCVEIEPGLLVRCDCCDGEGWC